MAPTFDEPSSLPPTVLLLPLSVIDVGTIAEVSDPAVELIVSVVKGANCVAVITKFVICVIEVVIDTTEEISVVKDNVVDEGAIDVVEIVLAF